MQLNYARVVNEICQMLPSGGTDCTWLELGCDGSDSCHTRYSGWTWNTDSSALGFVNFFSPDEDGSLLNGSLGDQCSGVWKHDGCRTYWSSASCEATTHGALCLMRKPEDRI